MKHSIPHDLDLPTAIKVTHRALETYQQRFAEYHPHATWLAENHAKVAFKAKGIKIEGDFQVKPGAVEVDLDVPFLLKPFQKRAIDVVEREVNEWIAKAKRGELV